MFYLTLENLVRLMKGLYMSKKLCPLIEHSAAVRALVVLLDLMLLLKVLVVNPNFIKTFVTEFAGNIFLHVEFHVFL